MRKIETTIYSFSELSDSAKQRVLEKLWDINAYPNWCENALDYLSTRSRMKRIFVHQIFNY